MKFTTMKKRKPEIPDDTEPPQRPAPVQRDSHELFRYQIRREVERQEQRRDEKSRANAMANQQPASHKDTKPLQITRWRQQKILLVIRGLGYAPSALPKNKPGKKGVKSVVRAKVGNEGFGGGTFNDAWDDLRSEGAIKDAP